MTMSRVFTRLWEWFRAEPVEVDGLAVVKYLKGLKR